MKFLTQFLQALGKLKLDPNVYAIVLKLGEMAERTGSPDTCWFSHTNIAAEFDNRSRWWACRWLNKAEELGLIEVERRYLPKGGQTSNRYRLKPCAELHTARAEAHTKDSGNTNKDSLSGGEKLSKPVGKKPEVAPQVPADWRPDEKDRALVSEVRPELVPLVETMADKLVKWYRDAGIGCRDLAAAWRKWVMNEVFEAPESKPKEGAQGGRRPQPSQGNDVTNRHHDENRERVRRMLERRFGKSGPTDGRGSTPHPL